MKSVIIMTDDIEKIGVESTSFEVNTKSEQYGPDSSLARSLRARHLLMISLGSSIGIGLWLGSGTSLAEGGPASLFLGYYVRFIH